MLKRLFNIILCSLIWVGCADSDNDITGTQTTAKFNIITTLVGANNSSTTFSVEKGADTTLSFPISSGYALDSAVINGSNKGKISSYSFSNVTQPYTVLLYVSAVTPSGKTVVEQNGLLSVKNSQLVNSKGKEIQLRGMSTHGIQYFDSFYTKKSLEGLAKGWGADIVRLSLYAREGGYEDNPAYYTERVDSLIEWATSFGIYVMIDWHQLTPGDPNKDKENAKTFFRHMASVHGDKINVLFDICNEPNDTDEYGNTGYTVTWSNHIKPYAEEIIPIIREHSNNIIIVGTPTWASDPTQVIGDELDGPNVMYSVHFYADSHKEWNRSLLQRAIDAGLPIFVTEFGTQNYAGEGVNNFWETTQWLNILAENKISWCNWNYSPDHRSGAVFKENATFSTYQDYADSANIKESGQWIMNAMKVPADNF